MAKKYYLNEKGLKQIWDKLDEQNSKIINKIDAIKVFVTEPSDDLPKNFEDEPEPGISNKFSRADHIHQMPTYEDVGAMPYRKCLIEGNSNNEEKGWRIFADTYLNNGDTSISFIVRKSNNSDSIGILTAFIEINDGNISNKNLKWNLLSGDIDPQDFKLICGESEILLAVKCSKTDNYMFQVLEEHNNYNDKESSWNLYDMLSKETDSNIVSDDITDSTIESIKNSCATAH